MQTFQQLKKNLKKVGSTFPEIKIALLGDTATQFLATAIRGEGAARGLNINLFEAEYNQIERQIMDPTSDLFAFAPDIVVVFQSAHKLLEKHAGLTSDKQMALAEDRMKFVQFLSQSIKCKIIYLNYSVIDDAVFGSFASHVAASFPRQVHKLNFLLDEFAGTNPDFFVCDLDGIQAKIGRNMMFAPNVYTSTEMVLSIDALPIISSRIMDIVCALRGSFKKCLILDLDNTLWGGVVGDDGWENIQLGHGLGIGKAFTEFQHWIKKLKERGIILAVCSKNNEATAKEAFEKNPEMVIKLSDIAVFVANWENKADNIRRIQKILNIGFDSMVFLDDNPAERAIVRENVPAITVPELPEDPAEYLEFLYGENLFETVAYSEADGARTKQYQVEAQRVQAEAQFTNEADFLKSLEMVSVVEGFTKFNTPRVAQLSQRSNQFNLRTVRYTEADITRIGGDSEKFVGFSFTLEDKFGDNGLICVVILEKNKATGTLFVDTWFMSCRVLKRGMENFTLNTIVEYARANGFSKIVGEYIETPKNAMVAEHFTKLGFTPNADEKTRNLFNLNVADYKPRECYITKK